MLIVKIIYPKTWRIMTQIHDKGYKKLFSNKVIFRQLLETFVAEDWVRDLDFDKCKKLEKSFVSQHYLETESDIIYEIKLRDKDVYIFILVEFQSSVDRFMALRILNYITNFYMDYVESNKGIRKLTLPPVFPILLYNGDKRWTAPTNLSELIENNDLLGKFSLDFSYFKISEIEYKKDDLLKIRNIVSTLFLAESHYSITSSIFVFCAKVFKSRTINSYNEKAEAKAKAEQGRRLKD